MHCISFLFSFRKCRHKKTELPYAVKIISRRVDVNREVTLLKLCQGHSNIIQLIDVFYDEVRFVFVILSLPLIEEGQLSVSGKRMCTILVNCLED